MGGAWGRTDQPALELDWLRRVCGAPSRESACTQRDDSRASAAGNSSRHRRAWPGADLLAGLFLSHSSLAAASLRRVRFPSRCLFSLPSLASPVCSAAAVAPRPAPAPPLTALTMVLWVEKYRPQQMSELTLHPELTGTLSHLTSSEDFPHLLLYGPSGGGKKTRCQALLRGLFGKSVDKVKVQHKSFKVKSKTVEISTLGSHFHIEMNPSDVGNNDRLVVQEVIKEIAQTQNVGAGNAAHAFKVVILNEVDRLSLGAQHALRRTMEKYTASCRLILVCESLSRVIAPLRSRCLAVRVPAPTKEQVGARKRGATRTEPSGVLLWDCFVAHTFHSALLRFFPSPLCVADLRHPDSHCPEGRPDCVVGVESGHRRGELAQPPPRHPDARECESQIPSTRHDRRRGQCELDVCAGCAGRAGA